MLGVGKSESRLLLAGSLAVLTHALLITTTLQTSKPVTRSAHTVSVTLLKEEQEEDRAPKEEPSSADDQVAQQAKEFADTDVVSEIEVGDEGPEPTLETPKVRIQTSISGDLLKKFVQSETRRYQKKNPASVSQFSNTFIKTVEKVEEIELDSREARAYIRGTSNFATQDKHGNRTCYGKIENFQDITAGPSYVANDCTPLKKFELNLNKPNNGWMNR